MSEEEQMKLVKAVLIGESGTGKTSIITRLKSNDKSKSRINNVFLNVPQNCHYSRLWSSNDRNVGHSRSGKISFN